MNTLHLSADKIKNLRLEYGLSRKLLGQMIGVSEKIIHKFESGEEIMSSQQVKTLLDVTILNVARKEIKDLPAFKDFNCSIEFEIIISDELKPLEWWGS